MSSLYANSGVDLDMIFFTGTGASMTGIIDDTGQDIGYKYSAGSANWDTGLVASSGQDIGRILGGEIAVIWHGPQTDKTTASDAAITAAWNSLSNFKASDSSWTKLPETTDSLSIGKHGTSKKKVKYSAYAFHAELAAVGGEIIPTLGAPTSNDGKVWLTEIRSPDDKVKNFVVCGLGGDKLVKKEEDNEWKDVYYSVYSYVTLTIAMKVAGITSKLCTVKFEF